jgi:hypothetical protein
LTITSLWVNTTLLGSTDFVWFGGPEIFPSGSLGPGDTTACLVPQIFFFRKGANYNFTVGTSSGRRYSFVYRCDDASVSPENMTVAEWEFVPGARGVQ